MKSTIQKPMKPRPLTTLEANSEFKRIGGLLAQKKVKEAWEAANDFWERDQKNALANFAIAVIIESHGVKAEAIKFAKIAIQQAPRHAGYHLFLAKLLVDTDLIEDAPPIFERAFQLDSKMYQAPWFLAKFYYDIGQGSKALPLFNDALNVAPADTKAFVQFDRAACLSAVGQQDEAKVAFAEISGQGNVNVHALTRLAIIGKNDHHSQYADDVRAFLGKPNISQEETAELLLCLGRLHENGKDYGHAFQNYVAARKLKKAVFDASDFNNEIEDKINNFSSEIFKQFKDHGNPTTKPIFIVGMPRSGTTMTEQIIAAHSKAEGVGELTRMMIMSKNICGTGGTKQLLQGIATSTPAQWRTLAQKYMDLLHLFSPDAQHTVDKLPHNFLNVGFIKLCFPNAKIIHCRRNPLDNFISAFQNGLSNFHSYSFDQSIYGAYYLQYQRLMAHWDQCLPGSIYQSDYEKLTENPEQEVRNLLDYLGLEFENECLNFHERQSTVRTLSREQVRSAINTKSIARWKNYDQQLGPIKEIFDKAGLNYERA